MEIHPAANAYRLMREDELAALTEDIGEHGLIDPIILGRVNGAETEQLLFDKQELVAPGVLESELMAEAEGVAVDEEDVFVLLVADRELVSERE